VNKKDAQRLHAIALGKKASRFYFLDERGGASEPIYLCEP
jgi:hypothetical protein